MEGTSYQVYLTKSHEAAELIAEGLKAATPWTKNGGKTLSIGVGPVNEDKRIPAIYQGQGFFYALIEYRNGEDFSRPIYEVILC